MMTAKIRNVVFDIYNVLVDESDGPIHEVVDLMMELRAQNVPIYAITNMSERGFESAKATYPFLRSFLDVVVSGKTGLMKPDPAIFTELLLNNNLIGSETLFIDDSQANVEGAKQAGMQAVQYLNPRQLENELISRGILVVEDGPEYSGCCGGGCNGACDGGCSCRH